MVIPMISVHYVDGLGWTAGAIGLVLAARQFFQQGLTPFSGVLADRIGAKPLIAIGMLVRAVGFAAMAYAGTYAILMGAAIVSAIGGALFESPRSAAVAALTDESERSSYFAKTGVGTRHHRRHTARGAAARRRFSTGRAGQRSTVRADLCCHSPLAAGRAGRGEGRSLSGSETRLPRPAIPDLHQLHGRPSVHGCPVFDHAAAATAIAGNPSAVAWVYAVNSIIAVVLGYPVPRLAERRLGAPRALIAGVLATAAGLALIGFARDTISLLLAVVVYSLGIVDRAQTVAAGLANPVALGSYFGVAVAFGGGLGSYAGGLLYDLGSSLGLPRCPGSSSP